jgi:hypothetical protein
MATTEEQRLRNELSSEREELADAVETLRSELGEATNVRAQLESKLPVFTAGAFGLGFVLAGGIRATARLLIRRGREGDEKVRAGRFLIVRRG